MGSQGYEVPPRLPRGSHGLSREHVVGVQRARLFRAIAEAMAEKGYVNTTVADVLRRAGIGRETFYQLFSSKEDCFIAAYETVAGVILAEVERNATGPGTELDRFEHTITAYLDALAAEPAFARLFMVEVYAAGDRVLQARAEIQGRFVQLAITTFGARTAGERFACEALVASVITLVTARLAARDVDGLRALRSPLTELVRAALQRQAS
ncbi:MAG TPA: TetR/AcrR family transcriptional regulator [Solirubrobacteraceae bacterium]|jgi:AcrR family transcriptional regulator|nr:TetR/AcrR family transcriptional regulator [Solirubrobacteraceae bacterium]